MGKISKTLLSCLFASRAAAETYAITGCNNESLPVSPSFVQIREIDIQFEN